MVRLVLISLFLTGVGAQSQCPGAEKECCLKYPTDPACCSKACEKQTPICQNATAAYDNPKCLAACLENRNDMIQLCMYQLEDH